MVRFKRVPKKINSPCGLQKTDTVQDAMCRADILAAPDGRSYSGMMTTNKDLRRIVLLVRELREAQAENARLRTALHDLHDDINRQKGVVPYSEVEFYELPGTGCIACGGKISWDGKTCAKCGNAWSDGRE